MDPLGRTIETALSSGYVLIRGRSEYEVSFFLKMLLMYFPIKKVYPSRIVNYIYILYLNILLELYLFTKISARPDEILYILLDTFAPGLSWLV